jgi:class 3 adenylate cyclase
VLGTFTAFYLVVFGALFLWFYRFSTRSAIGRLRSELAGFAAGCVHGISVDELLALYHQGQRNAQGFSDDPRYQRILDWFDSVHRLDPQAWPYIFIRGNQPDTRRAGDEVPEREFIYLVDLNARYSPDRSVHFLEPDRGSDAALEVLSTGKLVERPDVYRDKWGAWMTDYAPIVDAHGKVVAVLGVDFAADYVADVQGQVRRQMVTIFAIAYVLLSALVVFVYRARHLRGLFGRYASLSLLRDMALLELGYASRRRITVLFCDINDFSTICERHTPERVIQMLNDYFEHMNEIIVASGGWIKQFVGDEIMVIYGAPDDHPRPEAAAVETALKMVERLAALKAAAMGVDGFYEVKIGIHCGDVIVGNVGSRDRTEYAAVGDHVNLGSRIMGMAKPLGATILLSGATYEAVKELPGVELVDRGSHPVKGRFSKVRVYEAKPAAPRI